MLAKAYEHKHKKSPFPEGELEKRWNALLDLPNPPRVSLAIVDQQVLIGYGLLYDLPIKRRAEEIGFGLQLTRRGERVLRIRTGGQSIWLQFFGVVGVGIGIWLAVWLLVRVFFFLLALWGRANIREGVAAALIAGGSMIIAALIGLLGR